MTLGGLCSAWSTALLFPESMMEPLWTMTPTTPDISDIVGDKEATY